MIHRVKFQNFKALRNVEIAFDSRLTVLVGPNGSGKTSVLRGIDILCRVLAKRPPYNAIFSDGPPLSDLFSGDVANNLTLDAVENLPSGDQNGIQVTANPNPGKEPVRWTIYSLRKGSRKEYGYNQQVPPDAIPSFESAEFLQLAPAQLSTNTITRATPPRMELNGTGMPSVLAYLKLYDEDRFETIVEQFRKIIPSVKKIRPIRASAPSTGNMLGEGLEFELVSGLKVRAAAMSDGTLYILGLITAILSPVRPKVLLLDDIDHGLHPKAQMQLVELLGKLLGQNHDLQIIATSHSPYILDKLEWSQVRVTSLQDDGKAICVPLTEHPLYPKWKESMSPGEFWSYGGEEWVKNGKKEQVAQ